MTDWPDNLIDTLAKDYASRVEGIVSRSSGPVDVCRFHREWAEDFLAALAEWCDGDLYDPTTGQRIVKRHVCDGDWDDDGDDQYQQSFPFACNWTDAAGEMNAGAPLFTLSPLDPPEDT